MSRSTDEQDPNDRSRVVTDRTGEWQRLNALVLGHSSVQTTERYLGTKQNLAHEPNDAIKLSV
jgi:hypothetical protein